MNKSKTIDIFEIDPLLSLHENIAIVGSSPCILENDYGNFIDTFDDVVRFNRAPTSGWEKHVGSKTTLYVTNNHVFDNIPHNAKPGKWPGKGQPTNFIKDLKNQRVLLLNRHANTVWPKRKGNVDQSSQAFLGSYTAARNWWIKHYPLHKPSKYNFDPSCGMAFILLCLKNLIIPHLFGFGLADTHAQHYWEDKGTATSHAYTDERKCLKRWAEEKKLIAFK
jgi:hypothetical protein